MSNARDKANIPSLNFSSTGIDDNATSTAITINSSQNVGIGTASPTAHLQLRAVAPRLHFEDSSGAGTTYSNSITTNGSSKLYGNQGRVSSTGVFSSNHFLTEWDDANGYALSHRWYTGASSERMRIDSSGNVGIGTSTPTTIASDTTTATNDIILNVKSSGDARIVAEGNEGGSLVLVDSNATSNQKVVRLESTGGIFQIQGDADSFIGSGGGAGNIIVADLSNGNVGIGTSSPQAQLHIYNFSGGGGFRLTRGNNITGNGMRMIANSAHNYFESYGNLFLSSSATGTGTGASERLGISTSGDISSNSGNITGSFSRQNVGITYIRSNAFVCTRSSGQPLEINRTSNDGTLVAFYQNDTAEGTISVSGTTVSYNGFTGTHWSRFTDNSTPTILKGTVLETLDEMCDWYNLEFDVTTQDDDGNDVTTTEKIPHVLTDSQSNGDVITYNHEGTDYQATIVKENDVKHMMSKVSDTVDAKNVYGVFVAYDEDGEGYNDFYVASVGSFVVRIKANETIAKGDLLQSNGDGTAKVQSDDNVKSSSFAKVLSTTIIETYEDGSYLVPCSLMC